MSAPSEVANPRDATMKVFVVQPSGRARTPLVGGTCDRAKRPVVFLAHGYDNRDPATYRTTIDHLVSIGNVVVYSQYPGESTPPYFHTANMYLTADAGNVAAVAATSRIDAGRVGYVGHSYGGGMTAWLVQQGASRGWGSQATWLVALAPSASQETGGGDIMVPAHTVALVVTFDLDEIADHRFGMLTYDALTIGTERKQFVTVRTDLRPTAGTNVALVADHASPHDMAERNNAIKWYGIHRNIDAIESCSVVSTGCTTDLSYMGRWSDDVPVTPAISTDDPHDHGPVTAVECEYPFSNQRWQSCPPSAVL